MIPHRDDNRAQGTLTQYSLYSRQKKEARRLLLVIPTKFSQGVLIVFLTRQNVLAGKAHSSAM